MRKKKESVGGKKRRKGQDLAFNVPFLTLQIQEKQDHSRIEYHQFKPAHPNGMDGRREVFFLFLFFFCV